MLDQNIEGQSEDLELPFFNLATIAITTNNFSSNNKLEERWLWTCVQGNSARPICIIFNINIIY